MTLHWCSVLAILVRTAWLARWLSSAYYEIHWVHLRQHCMHVHWLLPSIALSIYHLHIHIVIFEFLFILNILWRNMNMTRRLPAHILSTKGWLSSCHSVTGCRVGWMVMVMATRGTYTPTLCTTTCMMFFLLSFLWWFLLLLDWGGDHMIAWRVTGRTLFLVALLKSFSWAIRGEIIVFSHYGSC